MYELPLFPLNTVLFPGTPISLHIFESRYKLMIEQCLQTGEPFGVVLIREGAEALGPLADPHPIGTTAQIAQVERLDDGRMNIVAIGVERFEIRDLNRDHMPYLVGTVESRPLDRHDASHTLAQAGQRLRPWIERYINVLSTVAQTDDFDLAHLPEEPTALAYLAAALLQIPAYQKQSLLAMNHAADLLTDIRTIYRREVALLNAIIERESTQVQGLFSLN
jgi:Lon protease-like protein